MNCDCGTCCAACGHYEDCGIYDEAPPVVSVEELHARAEQQPGSFLAFLLADGGGS